jgi:hypothetical protein
MLDATCVPDDIPCPVDLRSLNVGEALSVGVARETTEKVIDVLSRQVLDKANRKPIVNRDKARNLFLAIINKKQLRKSEIREAKRFQLNEIRRNLAAIDTLIHSGAVFLGLVPICIARCSSRARCTVSSRKCMMQIAAALPTGLSTSRSHTCVPSLGGKPARRPSLEPRFQFQMTTDLTIQGLLKVSQSPRYC